MWTTEQGALQEADQRLCQLLDIPALHTPLRLYRRQLRPVVFSKGLNKNKLEVEYQGFSPGGSGRLLWQTTLGMAEDWIFEASSEPHGRKVDPLSLTPEEEERWSRRIKERTGPCELTDLEILPSPDGPDAVWVAANAWWPKEWESILLRFDADTGAFLGWRHEGWFAWGEAQVPLQDPALLCQQVESHPLFIHGAQRTEEWEATDAPVHHEFLWTRYVEDRMVENDFVYASVNRATGKIAELLANVSPLEEGLDLTADQAVEIFGREFPSRFPGSTRCGSLKEMYLELPEKPAKPRVWAASAIFEGAPVQLSLGRGGVVVRQDTVA